MNTTDRIVNLLLVSAGFGAALLVYSFLFLGGLGPYGMLTGVATSIVAFWMTLELRSGGRSIAGTSSWVFFTEQFCLGTGVNLLLHSFLTYALYIRRTPLLIGLGGLFAAGLLTLRMRWRRPQRNFLLVGFDALTQKVLEALPHPVIGVVSDTANVPAGLAWLGGFDCLEAVVKKYRPTNIVLEVREWSKHIAPPLLLNFLLSGVEVSGTPGLYETIFSRVCCERLRPGDLLLSPALRGDSRTIAIQSVYTNLVGLSFLLVLSPITALTALVVALFSGPGPVIENFEAAGFQHIPFRLHRFRTTRCDGTAETTWVGGWISRLRLTNLPQLLNVVRGDMALVGPRPVRAEFARYLSELMPFYSHRFSVRPGIVGWAQLHARSADSVPDECRQIEYDLYYVKEGALWMDIEIMLESLWPPARPKQQDDGVAVPQASGF